MGIWPKYLIGALLIAFAFTVSSAFSQARPPQYSVDCDAAAGASRRGRGDCRASR